MQALVCPHLLLKEINITTFKFLWTRKFSNKKAFEKIKWDVLYQEHKYGGLDMITASDKQNAFIIILLNRIYNSQDHLVGHIPM